MQILNPKMVTTTAYGSLLAATLCLAGGCSSASAPPAPPAPPSTGAGPGTRSSSGSSGSSSGSSSGGISSSSGSSSSSSSSGGIPMTGVCAGNGTRVLTNTQADAFVDDFEESMISPGWSSFNDTSPQINMFKM